MLGLESRGPGFKLCLGQKKYSGGVKKGPMGDRKDASDDNRDFFKCI